METAAQSLRGSPELYPHSYEPAADAVGFVRLGRADYGDASFLDGRLLAGGRTLDWRPFAAVETAVAEAALAEDCGFIFHIGHVGSTLLSRLLDCSPQILGLREPQALRTLAQLEAELGAPESLIDAAAFEARLAALLKLWSRTFAAGQTTVIKATSFCSGMAPGLMARSSQPRAVFMFAQPEAYLATLLGGANNHIDIRTMAAQRLRRLHRRLGGPAWTLHRMSHGEMVAMSWACEVTALADAAEAAAGRALWLDFERFLTRPQRWLSQVLDHFGRPLGGEEVAAIIAGPEMGRYSKAPEHAYGADLRRQVLDGARVRHAGAIADGLAWLERAAAAHPAIAGALKTAGGV